MAEDRAKIEEEIQESIRNPSVFKSKMKTSSALRMIHPVHSISRLMAQTANTSKTGKLFNSASFDESHDLEKTV